MDELNKFYQTVMQDVVAMQSGDEDGDTQEQIFTRICQEMLSEAGETEDCYLAYDERDFGKKGQHKINGYSLSEIMRMSIYLSHYLITHLRLSPFQKRILTQLLRELQISFVRQCIILMQKKLLNHRRYLSLLIL